MNLFDMLMESQNNDAVGQVARQFGLGQDDTQNVMKQLMPMLARGMKKNTEQPGGLDALLDALKSGNHDQYVDKPNLLDQESTTDTGNAILGHIFGSKDVSRNVAAHTASQTGISSSIIKKMLPVIATMAMGALSKTASKRGMLGGTVGKGILGTILGGALSKMIGGGRSSSGAGGMLTSLLDADNDGSIADDVLSMAKRFI